MSSGNNIVLNYGDSLVKESDLRLLTDSKCSWLNDTLIGFYFEYLSEEIFPITAAKNGQRMKFFSPQVTHGIKLYDDPTIFIDTSDGELDSFDWLFFVINNSTDTKKYDSGAHWSLLVYTKSDSCFYHLDSSTGFNSSAASTLFNKLKILFHPEPLLKSYPCRSQDNSYDCGCHALSNAEQLGNYVLNGNSTLKSSNEKFETASPADADTMRSHIVQVIRNLKSKN